jgi:hypothetical protein
MYREGENNFELFMEVKWKKYVNVKKWIWFFLKEKKKVV